MSAACRRSPTPSTTPSRSWGPPTSRCRTTTGAIGGRRRIWECLRSDEKYREEIAMKDREEIAMRNREEIAQALAASGYIADGELATAISLMQLLRRPLLLEGEAGGGKNEVAQAPAHGRATQLVRPPCHQGEEP